MELIYHVEALKQVQIERPAYQSGAQEWWGEVIKRTALGAGADSAGVYISIETPDLHGFLG